VLLGPVVVVAAFCVTYAIMPWLIASSHRTGFTGKDLHKKATPQIPKIGGIGCFAGVAAALTISGLLTLDYRLLFAIFLSATLAVLAGLIDDLFTLGKVALIVLTFLISLPIIAFHAGSSRIYLSPFGPQDLGAFFWLLVPFAFAFLMNGVNIYAGFNGLEAGLGLVSSFSLATCAVIYGSLESAFSLFALAGALLAFLKWNSFPAKVFIGGSGTFLIGAVLASSIIAGSIKIVGIIALFPYIVNFILRAFDRFTWSVGETLPDGEVMSRKVNALWAIFMHNSSTSEQRIVNGCIALQVVFGLVAVLFAYYHATFVIPNLG
jgi:UDP-N-acetylglucosamine--dolichyl-phosphate N-acetylglucosaminephosphotransferase